MKRLSIIVVAFAVGLCAIAPCLAEQAKTEGNAKKDIGKVMAKYVAAFNKGNAKALAALYTSNADYRGPRGELIEGRDEIEKNYERFFGANQEVQIKIDVTEIRLVGTNVAIVDGTPDVTPPLAGPPVEIQGTLILVKRPEGWMIESVRDTLSHKPSNYDHLKELEWMVGDWADAAADSDEVSVESTCEWTANKNYLIRRFSATVKDRISVAGTQLIGWDSRVDKIRSWVFDSDGGFSEGFWQRDGNRWIVDSSGVRQNESEVSSINVITRIDDDSFSFESRHRQIGGRSEANIGPVTIKRKRPQAGIAEESPRQTILPP